MQSHYFKNYAYIEATHLTRQQCKTVSNQIRHYEAFMNNVEKTSHHNYVARKEFSHPSLLVFPIQLPINN